MTKTELAWLAGLLEGEGSFMRPVPSGPNKPIVALQMCDSDVVERVALMFGTSVHRSVRQKENHRDTYRTALRGERAVLLMQELRPFMGRRRQAQIDAAVESYVPKKPPQPCGTQASYARGCRCGPCGLANSRYRKAVRVKLGKRIRGTL